MHSRHARYVSEFPSTRRLPTQFSVYILYNHNRAVLTIIVLAFVAEVALMIIALGLVIPKQVFTSDCLVAHSPHIYIAYWLVTFYCDGRLVVHIGTRVSALAFETFLFILTLVQFSSIALREFRRHSILYVFIRDGTWAFALIFCAYIHVCL